MQLSQVHIANTGMKIEFKKFPAEVLEAMNSLRNDTYERSPDSEARSATLWQRGNYFPLAGAEQIKAVGDEAAVVEWVVLKTSSGNTYILDPHPIKDDHKTNNELIRVYDVRKSKVITDINYMDAVTEMLCAEVGKPLVLPNGGNTTDITEIMLLNGQWRG